jgi:hypothetical protein
VPDVIITFREELDEALLIEMGLEVRHLWPSIRSAAVTGTEEQLEQLAADERVMAIDPDGEITAF